MQVTPSVSQRNNERRTQFPDSKHKAIRLDQHPGCESLRVSSDDDACGGRAWSLILTFRGPLVCISSSFGEILGHFKPIVHDSVPLRHDLTVIAVHGHLNKHTA
jgi:hypothetical protein